MNNKRFQIGWYNVPEDKEYTDRNYECAGWFQTIMVKSGKYPVYAYEYEYNEKDRKYTNELKNDTPAIVLSGTVTNADFGARYCGMPIGDSKSDKYVGKQDDMKMYPYCHSLAKEILNNESEVELFPEFEAREINFIYDNEPHKTYGIFKKE
jgi:hypothetical protein